MVNMQAHTQTQTDTRTHMSTHAHAHTHTQLFFDCSGGYHRVLEPIILGVLSNSLKDEGCIDPNLFEDFKDKFGHANETVSGNCNRQPIGILFQIHDG